MRATDHLRGGLLSLPALTLFALFFIAPLTALFVTALQEPLAALGRLADNALLLDSILTSAALAVSAALISVVAGLAISEFLHRQPPLRRLFLLSLISLPLVFSGLIVAYGFILMLGRAGFVTLSLAELGVDPGWFGHLVYTPRGLAFVYCYYLIPRAVMIILPVLQGFDRRQLTLAASLGAGRRRRLLDIYLPQLAPTLMSAFSLCAAVAFGAYGTALALTGSQINILPILLNSEISDGGSDIPVVALLSMLMMTLCLLLTLPGAWLRRRQRWRAVAG